MAGSLSAFSSPEDWDNYIWRFFKTVTDPFLGSSAWSRRGVLPHTVVAIFGVLWLMALRIAYLITLTNLGLGPIAAQGA